MVFHEKMTEEAIEEIQSSGGLEEDTIKRKENSYSGFCDYIKVEEHDD